MNQDLNDEKWPPVVPPGVLSIPGKGAASAKALRQRQGFGVQDGAGSPMRLECSEGVMRMEQVKVRQGGPSQMGKKTDLDFYSCKIHRT